MYKSIATVLAVFTASLLFAQSATRLSGDVFISLEQETFKARYQIHHVPTGSKALSFMLNENLKIKKVFLNNRRIASSKNPKICEGCKVHNILIDRPLGDGDTLTIFVQGDMKNKNAHGIYDIFWSDERIEASGTQKWYPVIIEGALAEENALRSYGMTYNIDVNCSDCGYVAMGNGNPKKGKANFKSSLPTENIRLVAGLGDVVEGQYAFYLDVDEQYKELLDSKAHGILEYFTTITGLKLDRKPFLSGFEDLEKTIIDPNTDQLTTLMSKALAQELVRENYRPYSEFQLFYQNALIDYMRLKYLRDTNLNAYFAESNSANRRDGFVRLDKLEKPRDLNRIQDNKVVPYQFLAIAQVIGEDRMMVFFDTLFNKLRTDYKQDSLLTSSLGEIGINEQNIARIQNSVITNFNADTLFPPREVIVSY